MVGDFGSGSTQTSTFYCGKPEVDLTEILVGTGRYSGVFHPWKFEKDRMKNGETWGPNWGSKSDTSQNKSLRG